MEEFSLDSEAEDLPAPQPATPSSRRYSVPTSLQTDDKRSPKVTSKNPRTVLISNPDEEQYPSCSKSCTTFQSVERTSQTSDERTLREETPRDISQRPQQPLPCEDTREETDRSSERHDNSNRRRDLHSVTIDRCNVTLDLSQASDLSSETQSHTIDHHCRDCKVTIEEDEVSHPLHLLEESHHLHSLEESSHEDDSLHGRTFVHAALIEEIPVIVESKLTDDESSLSSDLELRSMHNTPKLIAQKSKSDPSISEEHGATIMTLTLATSLSCDQLVKHLQMKEKQTLASNSIHFLPWPQETLF